MANTIKYTNPVIMQQKTEKVKEQKLKKIADKMKISRTQLINDIIDEWFEKIIINKT